MLEFATIREALFLPIVEAIKAICTPTVYRMAESTAKGMQMRDMTQFVFAFIRAEKGSPSNANLCAWEGGVKETYRIMA